MRTVMQTAMRTALGKGTGVQDPLLATGAPTPIAVLHQRTACETDTSRPILAALSVTGSSHRYRSGRGISVPYVRSPKAFHVQTLPCQFYR